MKNARFNWPTFLIWSLLLCGGELFFMACHPSGNILTTNDKVSVKDSLDRVDIGIIGNERQEELDQAWENADSSNLTNNFYVHRDSGKVLSFEIPRSNVDTLLAQALKYSNDSIYLRVYLAADGFLELDSIIKEPVFRPILKIIGNKKKVLAQDDFYFEMDYLNMDILKYLKSLDSIHTSLPVSIQNAITYISAWDSLPPNKIYGGMYENFISKSNERVQYYTFDNSDTKGIVKYLTDYPEDLLYLHLGIIVKEGTIPFRTIIHLDNPENFEKRGHRDDMLPLMYEFASPCPKACGIN